MEICIYIDVPGPFCGRLKRGVVFFRSRALRGFIMLIRCQWQE